MRKIYKIADRRERRRTRTEDEEVEEQEDTGKNYNMATERQTN